MLDFYFGFFIVGIILAIVIIVFGDLLDGVLDGTLNFLHHGFLTPVVIVSSLTTFGGFGYLATKYFSYDTTVVMILSIMIAITIGILAHLVYVKPMKNAENSTSFSIKDLVGKIGEISITVPQNGCGEILIKIGAGITHQIASSFDKVEIKQNEKVVVVEVKDGVLLVSKL